MDQPSEQPERIWPLDVAITALAALVLYLILTKLGFDDSRWTHNGWTYVVAVPLAALLLSLGSRLVLSHYVQKSLQLGFFFSVFVHILLLILAVNVVIFHNYFPDALSGAKQERNPIRRTVPEYVFQPPKETTTTPDWSKPVDAESAARVVPTEKRQLPPIDVTAAKLEVPRPLEREQPPIEQSLLKRELLAESLPQPADSPGRLATPRRMAIAESDPWSTEQPVAPEVRVRQPEADTMKDQPVSSPAFAPQYQPSESNLTKVPEDLPKTAPPQATANMRRVEQQELPDLRLDAPARRTPRAIRREVQAAGASPATIAIELKLQPDATQSIPEKFDSTPPSRSNTPGASLELAQRADASLDLSDRFAASSISPQRTRDIPSSASPAISTGETIQRIDRPTRQGRSGRKFQPAGAPTATAEISLDASAQPTSDGPLTDRLATSDRKRSIPSRSSQPSTNQSAPAIDLMLDEGPVGLGSRVNRSVGIIPGESIPEVAALDLSSGLRRRRDLGGPVIPAGMKVAATESFSRRVKRTEGGASKTPGGEVGPATEKAIEQGLAYLASIQNQDGSWSLQGHGSEVVLRSDTAATGLCLLAFQGAGYTHRQHQYADTVSRGLKFLVDNQRTNGDLYRRENQISNDNVALYSHGIASLALCEAYGMTQDPELEPPAQACIRYMLGTQHRKRGGWRYTPQISADTSVTGWMMMALKSGELAGLEVPPETYDGIKRWLGFAQGENRQDRYRYNPFAPDTPTQRHGRIPTPTMTAVGMLMRMYMGWRRDNESMQSAADYLIAYPPQMGTPLSPQRDGYYWYYATMVMFHMGGDHWQKWNEYLKPVLLESQVQQGEAAGSWDPMTPVPDRWSPHAGRIYVTTMNLLNLEVYYRHLPIYDDSAQ